jgi:hypothetical protein
MSVYVMSPAPDWKDRYRLAITETDLSILPKRLADAHRATKERIEARAAQPRGEELQRIKGALHGLRLLQKEFESRVHSARCAEVDEAGLAEDYRMSASGDQNT